MRPAREVIADSRCRRARGLWGDWITMGPADWLEGADADMAALRAEGLVIVAEADVYFVLRALREGANMRRLLGVETRPLMEAVDRLDAALAAGGE